MSDTKQLPKSKELPVFPEDARIYFGTPRNGGYRSGIAWHEDEEVIRNMAAGSMGDGSGKIIKRVVYTTYSGGEGWSKVENVEIKQELEPVTVFTKEGQPRRNRFLADRACTHKKIGDWYLASGAGCQTDYEKKCLDCGKVVAWG